MLTFDPNILSVDIQPKTPLGVPSRASPPSDLDAFSAISSPTHPPVSPSRSTSHSPVMQPPRSPYSKGDFFSKAPTGRLPGAITIPVATARPPQSPNLLSVILVGQKVTHNSEDLERISAIQATKLADNSPHDRPSNGMSNDDLINIIIEEEEEEKETQMETVTDPMHQQQRQTQQGELNVPAGDMGKDELDSSSARSSRLSHSGSLRDSRQIRKNRPEDHASTDHHVYGRSSRVGGPIHLAPMIIEDANISDIMDGDANQHTDWRLKDDTDAFDFDDVDDVDRVGARYASIIEARARRLRGENVPAPPPMTPLEFPKRESHAVSVTSRYSIDSSVHVSSDGISKSPSFQSTTDASSARRDSQQTQMQIDHFHTSDLPSEATESDEDKLDTPPSIQVSYRLSSGAEHASTEPDLSAPNFQSASAMASGKQTRTSKRDRPVAFVGVPKLDTSDDQNDGSYDKNDTVHDADDASGPTILRDKPPLPPPATHMSRSGASANAAIREASPEASPDLKHKSHWRSSAPKSAPHKRSAGSDKLEHDGKPTRPRSHHYNRSSRESSRSQSYSSRSFTDPSGSSSGDCSSAYRSYITSAGTNTSSYTSGFPGTPKSPADILGDMSPDDQMIGSWEDDIIVKSMNPVAERVEKVRGSTPKESPPPSLPYAKYFAVDPFLLSHKPRLPSKTPDEKAEPVEPKSPKPALKHPESESESERTQLHVQYVRETGGDSETMPTDTSQGQGAHSDAYSIQKRRAENTTKEEKPIMKYLSKKQVKPKPEFREVIEAEIKAAAELNGESCDDQPLESGVTVSKTKFELKIDGSRMHFDMGTLARGTAILGTNWTPLPPALSVPGLLFHQQRLTTPPYTPAFRLPKAQDHSTIDTKQSSADQKRDNVQHVQKVSQQDIRKSNAHSIQLPQTTPTNASGIQASAVAAPSATTTTTTVPDAHAHDEGHDMSVEEFRRSQTTSATQIPVKIPTVTLSTEAENPIAQNAADEWISPRNLITPSPFTEFVPIAAQSSEATYPPKATVLQELNTQKNLSDSQKPPTDVSFIATQDTASTDPHVVTSLQSTTSISKLTATTVESDAQRPPSIESPTMKFSSDSLTTAKPQTSTVLAIGSDTVQQEHLGVSAAEMSLMNTTSSDSKTEQQRTHDNQQNPEPSNAGHPSSQQAPNVVVKTDASLERPHSSLVSTAPVRAKSTVRLSVAEDVATGSTHSRPGSQSSSRPGSRSSSHPGSLSSSRPQSRSSSRSGSRPESSTRRGLLHKPKSWKIVKKPTTKQPILKQMRSITSSSKHRLESDGVSSNTQTQITTDAKKDVVAGTESKDVTGDGSKTAPSSPDKNHATRNRRSASPGRRRVSKERVSHTSAAAENALAENPAQFYEKHRRKSAFNAAAFASNTEHRAVMSARPTIGVVVTISANDENKESDKRQLDDGDSVTGGSDKGDNEDTHEQEVDSTVLASRRLLQHAMHANGFTRGGQPSLYSIVHAIDRRKASMNSVERSRYPTFDDPGPPLDVTGTPIINLDGSEPRGFSRQEMEAEVSRLDALIDKSMVPIPANLRKRGIFLARLGQFKQASDDFEKAIKFDPFNSDAYWHRHQLYLRLNDVENALGDLDSITENNKQHLCAFQSKARIYQALGIIKLAIVNYSAVIRLKPDASDGYYNRACLFEAEGESVYANEDFRMVRQLDPSNEHAIYNLAIYSFQKQLWDGAAQEFTKLISINPENSQAYMLRGRAYASVAKYEEALEDLSTAIRIFPSRAQYFFHRGCLLRDRNPSRAVVDLSVSLLLDDTSTNCDAYYQRAKLYDKLGRHDLAISDYMSVIELDPTKSRAHLNLGIMHMKHFSEYQRALYFVKKAIAGDPINIQAYLCRADLYQLLNKEAMTEIVETGLNSDQKSIRQINREAVAASYLEKAVRDYSRAIHLCPNNYLLFLYRGRLLLKQGLMPEAALDFHAAFDLNASIAQTFIQRSLVLCFQRKYKQVIEEFDEYKKLQTVDDPSLLLLIAKARIRCGDFRGALQDLTTALVYSRNDPQIFLQRGICFEHLRDWSLATLEFSKCIAYMPTYSKAYYHRGLCKLYEGNDSGEIDLDMAIHHDNKFFEAYLTRASYYHAKGEYAKGIEDCNDALRLEPTSIRSHLLRGACKCKLNQYGLAITDFSKAINIDRSSYFAFYNRAVAYQLLNDLENAIKDYSIVLLLHEDSNAYRNRALIYWRKDDHENALLDLYAARDHFPQDAKLRGLLGLCLQKVGRYEESIFEFSMALDLNPYMQEALLGRGNVYASINDLAGARRDYIRVLHLYPLCAEAYVNVAYTMQTENRPKMAWNAFTTALTIDRQCTVALEGRAIVNLAMKNPFAALVDITKAIEICPENAEFLTNRGVVFQALNDDISALQSYKAAIQVDPNYSLAYFNSANLYMRQKLYERAIQNFGKATEINPQDKAAFLNRGICKVLLQNPEGALRDFDHAAEIDPQLPQVHYNRGHLLHSLGRYAEAERAFSKVVELSPSDSTAYLRRGQTRGLQSRWNEAMHDYSLSIAAEDA